VASNNPFNFIDRRSQP